MNSRSVVLLSSGLDSTLNLYEAALDGGVALALTFDYGQRAAAREIHNSALLCGELGIPHNVLPLHWLGEITKTSLVNRETEIPKNVEIQNHEESVKSAAKVWVPNRNGVMLSIAAAFAESLEARWVVPGFNAEEASTFPDNSETYIKAITESFKLSTANAVEVKCFTSRMNKTQIVERAKELGVNFDLIWPCYFGEPEPCGECESCLRFQRAMKEAR